jgi:hypothetical protein
MRLAIPQRWRNETLLWSLCVRRLPNVDFQIFVRLNPEMSTGILDYFVIPGLADIEGRYKVPADGIPASIDVYRANDLSGLVATMSCSRLLEAA